VRTVRQNRSEKPRGFPWTKATPVYHTTLALRAVLDEGLKPRRALGRDVHATGGGPDESVSFSTDKRVTFAIAVGLHTLARAARDELPLGQMIIELQRVAPKGLAQQINSMRLTPEKVVHIDNGLVPFSVGTGAWQHTVSMDAFLSADRHDLHDVTEDFAGGSRPYAARGWATPVVVERMQEESARNGKYSVDKGLDRYAANRKFELYKYMLSYSEWEHELYNPLFMHTDPETMVTVADDDIGIVGAMLGADWFCTDAQAADEIGLDRKNLSAVHLSDWESGCEDRLRHGEERKRLVTLPTREWEQPDAEDTVWYTRSMAEVRVYDTSLIRDLREAYNLDDVLHETRDAWDQKGIEWETPLAFPYFKVRQRA
jgi:hypothetical protein